MILTRDAILSADDLAREFVEIPEWGGGVFVRMMTGEERDRWELGFSKRRGKDGNLDLHGIRAELAAMVACDERGKSIFSVEDAPVLAKKSGSAIERICIAARKLNRLNEEDVEDLKKN